jgi:hypothetical protein
MYPEGRARQADIVKLFDDDACLRSLPSCCRRAQIRAALDPGTLIMRLRRSSGRTTAFQTSGRPFTWSLVSLPCWPAARVRLLLLAERTGTETSTETLGLSPV